MPRKKINTRSSDKITDSRFWTAICYPENMIDDWEDRIEDLIQLPCCYIIHDKDLLKEKDEERKIHVHIVIAFNNTTTINHATNVILRLSKEGKSCIPNNRIEAVVDMGYLWDYLIHNTPKARKARKHLYDKSERITLNNFDIGAYEQISIFEKHSMVAELSKLIRENFICNYGDFYNYVCDNYDELYVQMCHSYSSHFERLTRANFQKVAYREYE